MSHDTHVTNPHNLRRSLNTALFLVLFTLAGLGTFFAFACDDYQCLDRNGCDWPRLDDGVTLSVAMLVSDELPPPICEGCGALDPVEPVDVGDQLDPRPTDPGCRDCVPIDPPPPPDSEDGEISAESNRSGVMDHLQLTDQHDEWCKQHHYEPASCRYDDLIPLPEPVPDIEG